MSPDPAACRRLRRAAVVLMSLGAFAVLRPAPLAAQSMDSLLATAQRVARAWRRGDFAAVVGSDEVALQLPGGSRSAPLRPAQAAELLRAFAAGAEEASVEVLLAREVDGGRAYVEMERAFTVRGSGSRRTQTVYLGFRRSGASYLVAEIRILP